MPPAPLRFLISADSHIGGYARHAANPSAREIDRTKRWLEHDLEALHARAPESRFLVILGDLTENGSPEELRAYAEVIRRSPIPVRSVFGGHDGKNLYRAGELDRLRLYRDIVGPPWWTDEFEGVRFIALVSEEHYLSNEQQRRQETWFQRVLHRTPAEQPVVLLQHAAPSDERIASLARCNLQAVLYAHYHCSKMYRRNGVLVAVTPVPNTAGMNGEPRGAMEIIVGQSGASCRRISLSAQRRPSVIRRPSAASTVHPQEDWPDFHGGGALRVRRTPYSGPLQIAWSANTEGDILYHSPVVAGGSVYLATGGSAENTPAAESAARESSASAALLRLDGSTGELRWRTTLPFPAGHTPVVTPSGVLALTTDGTLSCFDPDSGRLLWSYREQADAARWAFHGPAASGEGDTVFLRTASPPPVSTSSEAPVFVVALRAADGTVLWKHPITHTDWMCTAGIPLCVEDRLLVPAVLGNGVSCFDTGTGTLLWDTEGVGELTRAAASPGYDRRRALVLATGYWKHPLPIDSERTGSICALRMADGSVAWRAELSERLNSSPVAAGDVVLVAEPGRGSLVAMDADSGAVVWRLVTGAPLASTAPGRRDVPSVSSTPAVAGETAYFGAGDGCLYGVDVRTGKQTMRCALGASVASSPALSGDTLYVGACDGRLYALTAG